MDFRFFVKKCAPRLRNTHSGEQDRIRGLWAARVACGQFRILFFFLQKSAQRSPLDGQVVPSWSPGALTKCFVFYTLGTGGRRRGQLWGLNPPLPPNGAVYETESAASHRFNYPQKTGAV